LVTKFEIDKARAINPLAYLESQGWMVWREGKYFRAKFSDDIEIRLTPAERNNGHWVFTERSGEPGSGGDNIALVRYLDPSISFKEAVERLLKEEINRETFPPPASFSSTPKLIPTLPPVACVKRGMEYLNLDRGISLKTIREAAAQEFIRFTYDAVLFVGYDEERTPRNINCRATDSDAQTPKRDLAGSDKCFPAIFRGTSDQLWVVEGGVDALAAHDLALLKGHRPPTVIVSGGALVRCFLNNEVVIRLLKAAGKVYVAMENEKSEEAQVRTDAAHQAQAMKIAEVSDVAVILWKPKVEQGKDLADILKKKNKIIS
jgi:hypothetical protein